MANRRQIKVAVVGCGQIADAHLHEIRGIRNAELVGVCDNFLDLAKQAAARFEVPLACASLEELIEKARPDVIHITTPPHSHHALALKILAAGAHVYIEKPFAVTLEETDAILAKANACRRLVCVGHDQQFDPAWQECLTMVRRGDLGQVVHVEGILGYDLSGPFGKLTASDPSHWVHRLPGGFFQNTISHAVYKILDFLPDERPEIWAHWFDARHLGFPTELHAFFKGEGVTANLISSSLARPIQRVTRVYGSKQTIEVDLDGRLVRRYRTPSLRGPFVKLEIPYRDFREAFRTLRRNLSRFFRAQLHFFTGMATLFDRFYRAILENGPVPISHQEIRRNTAIMEQIFISCRQNLVAANYGGREPINHLLMGTRSGMPETIANGIRP